MRAIFIAEVESDEEVSVAWEMAGKTDHADIPPRNVLRLIILCVDAMIAGCGQFEVA